MKGASRAGWPPKRRRWVEVDPRPGLQAPKGPGGVHGMPRVRVPGSGFRICLGSCVFLCLFVAWIHFLIHS
jgi:hypothetical protein